MEHSGGLAHGLFIFYVRLKVTGVLNIQENDHDYGCRRHKGISSHITDSNATKSTSIRGLVNFLYFYLELSRTLRMDLMAVATLDLL